MSAYLGTQDRQEQSECFLIFQFILKEKTASNLDAVLKIFIYLHFQVILHNELSFCLRCFCE